MDASVLVELIFADENPLNSFSPYHVSPFEHCVDRAADQFSVDSCQ